MKFRSMEEFRQYYFPVDEKHRKELKEEGTCPECEGTGKTERGEWKIKEKT